MVGTVDPKPHLADDNGHRTTSNRSISSSSSSSGGIDGHGNPWDCPTSSRQPHHHQLGHGIVDPILEDSIMSHFLHGSLDGDPTQDGASNNSDEDKNTAAFSKGDDLAWMAFLAVSFVVFFVSKNSEVKDFETQFETHAKQALESIQTNVATKLGAMESLAVGLTSQFGTTTTTT
jgi:hypothetical protein